MELTVYQLPDEPIIIATLTGTVTGEGVREMFNQTATIMGDSQERWWRITDVRNVNVSPIDAVMVIKEIVMGGDGSVRDKRVRGFLLGNHQWAKMTQKTLSEPSFGGLDVPVFETIGDAVKQARIEINRYRSGM
jgi:hypothetical protein